MNIIMEYLFTEFCCHSFLENHTEYHLSAYLFWKQEDVVWTVSYAFSYHCTNRWGHLGCDIIIISTKPDTLLASRHLFTLLYMVIFLLFPSSYRVSHIEICDCKWFWGVEGPIILLIFLWGHVLEQWAFEYYQSIFT